MTAPAPARIVLLGHGRVGRHVLQVLAGMPCRVVAVCTHRAAPGDWQPSLAPDARRLGIPVQVDLPLGTEEAVAWLSALHPDLIVSAYFREIVPDAVLATARRGGINLHGSPLPSYRGRVPVNWMVLRGETEGGVALHVMTSRADRGPILGRRLFPIAPDETAFDALLNVAEHGGALLQECILPFLAGELAPTPQGPGETFGGRRPEDGRVDWSWPHQRIIDLVRAVTRPYPGAFAPVGSGTVELWWIEAVPEVMLEPGEVRLAGPAPLVGTGGCAVRLVDYAVRGAAHGCRRSALEKLVPSD